VQNGDFCHFWNFVQKSICVAFIFK
jgi:hypothetical protein